MLEINSQTLSCKFLTGFTLIKFFLLLPQIVRIIPLKLFTPNTDIKSKPKRYSLFIPYYLLTFTKTHSAWEGVADVRLRINFYDELNSIEHQNLQAVVEDGVKIILKSVG
jgi:hypothetical protein